jgi:hypothetical protein
MSLKEKIIKLADKLDQRGMLDDANTMDEILQLLEDSHMEEHQEEEHHDEPSYMAKPQLAHIAKEALDCFHLVEDGEMLDDWMESYIAQAELMISQVAKKLKYQKGVMMHGEK